MNIRHIALLAVAAAAFVSTGVSAQTATASDPLDVTATVVESCSVTTTDMSFGNYDHLAGTTSTATVSVTCSSGTGFEILLGDGDNFATDRRMKNGTTNFLAYTLKDPTNASNWGGVADSGVSATADGSVQPFTVNGAIAAGQTVPAGAYVDQVSVTVAY